MKEAISVKRLLKISIKWAKIFDDTITILKCFSNKKTNDP